MKLLIAILLTLSFTATACNNSSSGDSTDTTTDSTTTPTATPVPTAETYMFGDGGNLYKPRADGHSSGAGNLVVLFDASLFPDQFDNCQAVLNTGETSQLICINNQSWTQIPFSCFSNGNRQTWRASFPCEDIAEVKISCFLNGQEMIFTVAEAQRGFTCNRFG